MKFTSNFLKKVEEVFQELDYTIIYGKGNFQSSYCVVERENKVVVNKYFGLQGKIEVLMEILLSIDIDHDKLSPGSKYTLKNIHKHFQKAQGDEN